MSASEAITQDAIKLEEICDGNITLNYELFDALINLRVIQRSRTHVSPAVTENLVNTILDELDSAIERVANDWCEDNSAMLKEIAAPYMRALR